MLDEAGDGAAAETAAALARALRAEVAAPGDGPSTSSSSGRGAEGRLGRVALSAAAEYEIETSAVPVLVVPRGAAVHFPEPTLAAA